MDSTCRPKAKQTWSGWLGEIALGCVAIAIFVGGMALLAQFDVWLHSAPASVAEEHGTLTALGEVRVDLGDYEATFDSFEEESAFWNGVSAACYEHSELEGIFDCLQSVGSRLSVVGTDWRVD